MASETVGGRVCAMLCYAAFVQSQQVQQESKQQEQDRVRVLCNYVCMADDEQQLAGRAAQPTEAPLRPRACLHWTPALMSLLVLPLSIKPSLLPCHGILDRPIVSCRVVVPAAQQTSRTRLY